MDNGAIPTGRAAAADAVEPGPVSSQADIPIAAGDWVLFRSDRDYSDKVSVDIKRAVKVTLNLVKFGGGYPRQIHRISVVAAFPDEAIARQVRDSIGGVAGEFNRRRRAAEDERSARIVTALDAANEQVRRIVAQAMSAGTAKTATPAEGDSPPARSGGCAHG